MLYLTQHRQDGKSNFTPDDCWTPKSWLSGWTADELSSGVKVGDDPGIPAKSSVLPPESIAAVCRLCGCPVFWRDVDGRLDCWSCTPPPLPAFVDSAFLVVEKSDTFVWLEATAAILACFRHLKRTSPTIGSSGEINEIVRFAKLAGANVSAKLWEI